MKIAMIANGGGSGGLITYINGLLSVDTEHDVMLFCTSAMQDKLHNISKTIKVHVTENAFERGIDIVRNKKLNDSFIKEIQAYNPDVVLFLSGWIRRGLEQYPNVMVLHNQLYVNDFALKNTLDKSNFLPLMGFRHAVRRSMKKADGVVFLSEKSREEANGKRIKFKKNEVIHFGLSTSTKLKNVDKNENIIKLAYVSAFVKYKHHDELIKAIAILRDKGYNLSLDLVGSGPEDRELVIKNMVDESGLSDCVNFRGWLPHDDALGVMADSDIVVYPSEIESTGLGVMEAMAQGACVVSSDMSCMPEVLKDAGVYFNPYKPEKIAEAIEKVINDEALRNALAQKGLDYSKEYTWERAARKHYAFLMNL